MFGDDAIPLWCWFVGLSLGAVVSSGADQARFVAALVGFFLVLGGASAWRWWGRRRPKHGPPA